MANYTLFADDDKKQVNGSAITATSTVVVGGSASGLGTSVPTGPITAQRQLGLRSEVHGSQVIQGRTVFGVFHGAGVVATSVADDGNGYCQFTKNSHSLVVGDAVNISGSTSGNLDGVHKVTAKDANTFTTNVPYVASATPGTYALVAGRFASMTAEQYIMLGYTSSVANGQATRVGFGADYGIRRSIHKLEAMRTRRVATAIRAGYWNEYSGSFTTAPTNANDIATWGTDDAATPTRLVPGELTYRVSGMQDATNGVTQDNYSAKTQG